MVKEHTEECKCFQCGGDFVKNYDFDTGYGVNHDGHRICFKCCGENDRKDLDSLNFGEKIIFYFTKENNEKSGYGTISNWPGSLKISCYYRKGWHNMAQVRHDVWFTFNGKKFHGVQYGYNSELCYIKRVKN